MAKVKSDAKVVFGIHAIEALLKHNSDKIQVLYLQQRDDKRIQTVRQLAKSKQIKIEILSPTEFTALSQTYTDDNHHQGVIAICNPHENTLTLDLPELLSGLTTPPLLLVLDGVQDPHNLGACLRSANAAGAHAVIIPKDRAVAINATVKKVASGAAEITPVISVTNLARTLRWLKEQGVWLYGMAGEAKQMIYQAKFTYPTAFVLGAEGDGLRTLTKEHCDELLAIPSLGTVSSLNVSVAAGICLFEAVRQRIAR